VPDETESFVPGVLTTDSGGQYLIDGPIGTFGDDSPCDAAEYGAHPSMSMLDGRCRCVVCARCGHHTGNSHQGHYWKSCQVLAGRLRAELKPGVGVDVGEWMRLTSRPGFHMCCPDPAFGCEYEEAPGA
jgi:hypothetical protein